MKQATRIFTTELAVGEFLVPSPAQQLLDRFLLRHASRASSDQNGWEVLLHTNSPASTPSIQARVTPFGLKVSPLATANFGSEASLVIAGRDASENESIARAILPKLPAGARCFVYGSLAGNTTAARELVELGISRGAVLAVGSAVDGAFRLPDIRLPARAKVDRALIVTHGTFPDAELDGLEGLSSVIREGGAEPRILASIEPLSGARLWDALYSSHWRSLFAAAISRSDNIQGDALKDGRTQDAVGLHLIEKLAAAPRGWLLRHTDRSEALHLVLDGAVHDVNFAVQLANGKILSAQLYRPPPPAQAHFNGLADRIIGFFSEPMPRTDRGHILYLATCLEGMQAAQK
jgi:hypothetical protein